MTLPTKAVLYAATYPRDPKPGAPCNISIAQFNNWLAEELRKAKETAWDEGFDAGEQDVHQHKTFNEPCIPNPYRSKA